MNFFDYIFFAVTLFFAVRSLLRGFFREVGAIAGIIGGIIIARLCYQGIAPLFTSQLKSNFLANVLAFVSIFLAVYIAGILTSIFVQKMVGKTVGGLPDRLGGMLFGIVKGIVLCGIFVYLVRGFAGTIENSFLKNSAVAPYILSFMDFLSGLVPRGQ